MGVNDETLELLNQFEKAKLSELLLELKAHREREARVRAWFSENAVPEQVAGVHPVDRLLDLADTCRAAVTSMTPVLVTMWQTIQSRFSSAGIKLPPQ